MLSPSRASEGLARNIGKSVNEAFGVLILDTIKGVLAWMK